MPSLQDMQDSNHEASPCSLVVAANVAPAMQSVNPGPQAGILLTPSAISAALVEVSGIRDAAEKLEK